jgi:hypothetical protein
MYLVNVCKMLTKILVIILRSVFYLIHDVSEIEFCLNLPGPKTETASICGRGLESSGSG